MKKLLLLIPLLFVLSCAENDQKKYDGKILLDSHGTYFIVRFKTEGETSYIELDTLDMEVEELIRLRKQGAKKFGHGY